MLQSKTTFKFSSNHTIHWLLLLTVATIALAGCQVGASAGSSTRGKHLFVTCAECHGPLGEGTFAIGAPNIAGMDAWYIEAELRKFRAGIRGAQFEDTEGMRMRTMALSL